MARPLWSDISSEQEAWDVDLQDNINILKTKPFPVFEHAGTEANLESTFPANQYDRCLVTVNHTSLGWVLYFSTGTVWKRVDLI